MEILFQGNSTLIGCSPHFMFSEQQPICEGKWWRNLVSFFLPPFLHTSGKFLGSPAWCCWGMVPKWKASLFIKGEFRAAFGQEVSWGSKGTGPTFLKKSKLGCTASGWEEAKERGESLSLSSPHLAYLSLPLPLFSLRYSLLSPAISTKPYFVFVGPAPLLLNRVQNNLFSVQSHSSSTQSSHFSGRWFWLAVLLR